MKVLIIIAFCCFLASCRAGTIPEIPERCNKCQSVIDTVQKNFQNGNREEAYHNFLQVCNQKGTLSTTCNKINETIFDEIYKHLESSLLPNDFCFNIGECSTNVVVPVIQITKSIQAERPDDPACEMCKELVKYAASDLTEDDFHELLLSGCKDFNSFQSDCKNIVDEYYPLLHDYLIDQINAKAVCSFFGFCSGPGLFGAPIPLPKANTIPKVVPTIKPVPQPVPIPVRPRVSVPSYSTGSFSVGSGWNTNYGPSSALATPLAGLAALGGAFAAALPAIPLLALG